jgi:hypothetical protein
MVSVAAACPSPRNRFLQLLPAILATAGYAFRHLKGDVLQDALAEVVAGSYVMFVALVRRGRESLAYGTPLAKFAIAQYNDGRRVGNSLNVGEVLSDYARQRKCFKVESLDNLDHESNEWQEVLVEDRHCGPFDLVRTKLDVDSWLKSLPRRDRKVAQFLSLGNRTSEAAVKFGVSQGRISQVRRELAQSWKEFTGDNEATAA